MSESVIPFAPARKSVSNEDPLEQAGQHIMGMLQQAAAVAKENCQHAVDLAHKLSLRLRAAEDRARDLEAEVRYYQERAARAEQWLLHISRDIEQKFLDADVNRQHQTSWHQPSYEERSLRAAE